MKQSPTRLQYKPIVKKMYWIAFWFLIVAELIVIRVNIKSLMSLDAFDVVIRLLVASTAILSVFYRLFVFVRPRVFSDYQLYSDKIEISTLKRKPKVVEFDQVSEVKFFFSSWWFFSGFQLSLKSGANFTFSTLLEGAEKVLDHLKLYEGYKISSAKLAAYTNSVRWAPHAWERLRTRIGIVWYIPLLVFFGPGVNYFLERLSQKSRLLEFFEGRLLTYWFVLFIINFALVITLTIVEDSFAKREFLKQHQRAWKLENRLFYAKLFVYMTLGLALSFFLNVTEF